MPLGLVDCVVASIGFCAMLWVLPHTRARAKVRPAHLWRATAFGLAWLGMGILLLGADSVDTILALLLERSRFIATAPMAQRFAAEWHWYVLTWIAMWWYFAIACGFKVERPAVVWIASAVPVALLVLTVRVYLVIVLKVY